MVARIALERRWELMLGQASGVNGAAHESVKDSIGPMGSLRYPAKIDPGAAKPTSPAHSARGVPDRY